MRVLITGLTGTLGTALARLHHARGDTVVGCARSEGRAVEWLRQHADLGRLILCDATQIASPRTDLGRALATTDKVYHCAAMKHVDLCEMSPHEAMWQNVNLTSTVAHVCKQAGKPLVFISTDKACLPNGVYGATKLLAERIALRDGAAVVRLGNLIGSSGSVFSVWSKAVADGKPVKVTDRHMTRFFIGTEEAAEFVADEAACGEVSIPHPMLAARMGDVADAVADGVVDVVEVGRRPGETQHQWLVAPWEPYRGYRHKLTLDPEASGDERGVSSLDAVRSGLKWNMADLLQTAGCI